MGLESSYNKHGKKFMLIPVILLILSIVFLLISPIKTDISLKGGLEVSINQEGLDYNELKTHLESNFEDVSIRELTDLTSRKNIGVLIQVANIEESELKEVLSEKVDVDYEDNLQYSVREVGAKFASGVYKSLIIVILIAFLLMGLAVLVSFRTFIPSVAVIAAAFMDIVITLAIINILGIKLSSAGIIAFLLVIGYSIDTDVLLTTRLLKRKMGSIYERLKGAMTTGLTMSGTTIAALLVATIVSSFISPQLKIMFLIILIALVVDIISTYLFNACILLWYCKRKNIT